MEGSWSAQAFIHHVFATWISLGITWLCKESNSFSVQEILILVPAETLEILHLKLVVAVVPLHLWALCCTQGSPPMLWESLRACKTLLCLLGLLWILSVQAVLEILASPRRDTEQEEINFYCATFVWVQWIHFPVILSSWKPHTPIKQLGWILFFPQANTTGALFANIPSPALSADPCLGFLMHCRPLM